MIDSSFTHISALQYRLKAAQDKLRLFESGEMYVKLRAKYNRGIRRLVKEIFRLSKQLADAHAETVTVHNNWIEIIEETEREYDKAASEAAALSEEVRRLKREKYELLVKLDEAEGKIQKLTNQINMNHENSSKPSSSVPNHKKIHNSREITGRKRGAQPGHKGSCLKKIDTENKDTIYIPAPDELVNDPDKYLTGRKISRQVIDMELVVRITEYWTHEFKSHKTGHTHHAQFPANVINPVNYGGTVKAIASILNNKYNVSIDGVKDFIKEVSRGAVHPSKGMINDLCRQFSGKTDKEMQEIWDSLLSGHSMNLDFTTSRSDGKNKQISICCNKEATLYTSGDSKGHKGIAGTPAEIYTGVLIHDHDSTFYSYGSAHQECLAHILRYLKGSMENEPDKTWSTKMRSLLQEIIHHVKHLPPDSDVDEEVKKDFRKRYTEIIDLAADEYDYEPPSDYYRDGYNLYKRLKSPDEHLLFLEDRQVSADNNDAERGARKIKRKTNQVMTFRSDENLKDYCKTISVMSFIEGEGENLFEKMAMIYNR